LVQRLDWGITIRNFSLMVFNALFTWGLSNKLGIPLTLNSSNIAVCLLLVPSPQLITSASTESGIRVKIRKIKVLDYFVLDDLVFLFHSC
jgi:hypothetical protein